MLNGGTILLILAGLMAANVLWGYGVIGAAHDANPALRRAPQLVQFLSVIFWGPIAFVNWRRRRKHRARWRG